ncbi:MAG TPA: ATP-binding protein [Chloroflexota bacterium]|nr:ATP-binding protein [Chloroflexota bacterium]
MTASPPEYLALPSPSVRMRWWQGLAPRVALLAALTAIVSGSLAGSIAVARGRASLQQQIFRSNLAVADVAADFAWRTVEQLQASVQNLAARPNVAGAILLDIPENVAPVVLEMRELNPLIDGAGIIDHRGVLRVSGQRESSRVGAWLGDREYYVEAMKTRQPYLGQATMSHATGRPAVPYSVPVLDSNGDVAGIVFADLSLQQLSQTLVGLRLGPSARISLIDRRNAGTILVHPDPARVLEPVSGVNEATSLLLVGQRGSLETPSSDGQPELSSFTPVPNLPWGVLVQQPTLTAYQPLDEGTRQVAGFVALITLCVTALSILLAVRFMRPMIRLRKAAGALARGDFSQRLNLPPKDEVGELAQAFDHMADALAERAAEVDVLTGGLEQKVVERTEALTLANRAVEREKGTLDAVMAGMTDGLLVVEAGESVRYANRRALDLLGLASVEPGSSIEVVFASLTVRSPEPDGWGREWRQALAHPGQSAGFDMTLTVPERRHLRIQTFPLAGDDGEAPAAGVLIRDVTPERELLRTKDELLAVLGHEVTTPVSSLVGFSELLLTRKLSDQQREVYLTTMRDQGRRLGRLMKNILDLQRMESGGFQLRARRLDAADVLRRAASSAGDGAHPLDLDLPCGLPPVMADEHALAHTLEMLVSNACKYSPEGSPVEVRAAISGDMLEVSVSDSGVGLTRDSLARLFDKFYRQDNSDRRTTQGAGLELAICRKLVEAHGGRIWAESAGLGLGSRFAFTVPLAIANVGSEVSVVPA